MTTLSFLRSHSKAVHNQTTNDDHHLDSTERDVYLLLQVIGLQVPILYMGTMMHVCVQQEK